MLPAFIGGFIGAMMGAIAGNLFVEWERGKRLDDITKEIIKLQYRIRVVEVAPDGDRGKRCPDNNGPVEV